MVIPAIHPRQERRQTLDADRAALLKSAGVANAAEAHGLLARRRDLGFAGLKGFELGENSPSVVFVHLAGARRFHLHR